MTIDEQMVNWYVRKFQTKGDLTGWLCRVRLRHLEGILKKLDLSQDSDTKKKIERYIRDKKFSFNLERISFKSNFLKKILKGQIHIDTLDIEELHYLKACIKNSFHFALKALVDEEIEIKSIDLKELVIVDQNGNYEYNERL